MSDEFWKGIRSLSITIAVLGFVGFGVYRSLVDPIPGSKGEQIGKAIVQAIDSLDSRTSLVARDADPISKEPEPSADELEKRKKHAMNKADEILLDRILDTQDKPDRSTVSLLSILEQLPKSLSYLNKRNLKINSDVSKK